MCSVNPYTASGYFTYIINVTNLSKPSNVQPTCCKLSNSSKPQISNWLSVKSRQRVQINRHQIDKFPFLNAYKLLLRKSQIQLCRAVQRPRSKFPQALKPSALHCKAWDRGCQFPDVQPRRNNKNTPPKSRIPEDHILWGARYLWRLFNEHGIHFFQCRFTEPCCDD